MISTVYSTHRDFYKHSCIPAANLSFHNTRIYVYTYRSSWEGKNAYNPAYAIK